MIICCPSAENRTTSSISVSSQGPCISPFSASPISAEPIFTISRRAEANRIELVGAAVQCCCTTLDVKTRPPIPPFLSVAA